MESSRIHNLRLSPEEIEKFQAFFMERSGLVFEGRRLREMERAIAGRMIELGISSFARYHDFLGRNEGKEELNQLALSLTVGETHFFRTPDQFAALRKYVLPELIARARAGSRRLLLLSAGCATGEEPYTLFILLSELIPDLANFRITIRACDINKDFLDQAREGIYGERKVKFVDPVTRDRFFHRLGKNRWQVKEEVRRAVEFQHFNLNEPDFSELAKSEQFDLVLCRNVLIYFNMETVKEAIRKFHKIIAHEGYLMLGYSETLFKISDAFQSIHTPEAYFYQKTLAPSPVLPIPDRPVPIQREQFLTSMGSRPHPLAPTRPEPERRPTPLTRLPIPAPAPSAVAAPEPAAPGPTMPNPSPDGRAGRGPSEEDLWRKGLSCFAEERFSDACSSFEEMVKLNPQSARAHLGLGLIYANTGADDRSRHHVEEAKRYDDLMPEIYFLQALLEEKNGEFQRAVENYQRVILLQQDFAMAHFNLGNLFLKITRPRDARREFENTLKILERDPDNRSLHFSGGLSREAVMEFCRLQLDDGRGLPRRGRTG